MINPELLRKIRRLHFHTQFLVNDTVAGSFGSVFKGRGMEFLEVREYRAGDDVRDIDWNVTARAGKPFVKEYREERELTVMLVVDVSASQLYGSGERSKLETAAEVAALLAFIAIKNNDKIGALLFSDRVEHYIPPKKGRGHVWRVIREILSHKPQGTKTDIGGALQFLQRVVRRRSICFLISDFLDEKYEKLLRIARQRHDVVAVKVEDPLEHDWLPRGFLELEDAEKGGNICFNTSSRQFREFYRQAFQTADGTTLDLFKSLHMDLIPIGTGRAVLEPVVGFLKKRARRR